MCARARPVSRWNRVAGLLAQPDRTQSTPGELHVVGHSKGGPLAAAVALWLADTQGTGASAAEQWDPNHKARISSYTFAAPTPGNSAFARHFGNQISEHYRLFNPLDIIPHVWNATEANEIPTLYNGELKILEGLVEAMTPVLQRLDYEHEAPSQTWGVTQPENLPLAAQIAFHHADAYLRKLKILGGQMTLSPARTDIQMTAAHVEGSVFLRSTSGFENAPLLTGVGGACFMGMVQPLSQLLRLARR